MTPDSARPQDLSPLENVFGRAAASLAAGLIPTVLLPGLISAAVYIPVGSWLWLPTRQALAELAPTLSGAQSTAVGNWIAGSITAWTLIYALVAYLVFHYLVMPAMPSGADVARRRSGSTSASEPDRRGHTGVTPGSHQATRSADEPGWVDASRSCLAHPTAPLFAFVAGGFLGFAALVLGGVL